MELALAEPEFVFTSLRGNSMKLDGGAMFGNAPKALWGQWMAADDQNMIRIASQSLLVQTPSSNLLFETGAGAYLSPEMKKRFQVQEDHHVLLDSLAKVGLDHGDITHVILSHLHFDHAGGVLKPYEAGVSHELLFPNARFITGQKNFDRSGAPHVRDRASFIPGLAGLLEKSGRLDLKQDKDRLEMDGLEIEFIESHGHTPGMLLSLVKARGVRLLFAGDLTPGHQWVNLPITMGYDRFPEGLIDEKQQILNRALNADAYLFYTHDPLFAASKLFLDPIKKRVLPVDLMDRLNLAV